MHKIFSTKLAIAVITLFVLVFSSCSDNDVNLNELDETIFIRHKNADMPAYIHGNGSEKVFLIILHGGPGGDGLQYRLNTIKSELESNYAVVYFDQRGSGNSQGNYAAKDVSIDLMAEDVLALAKVIKAKYGDDSRLFLMGHSWGGLLGTATLLKDQQDFSGWIFMDGVHDPKGAYAQYKVVLKAKAEEQIALGHSVDYWQDVIDLVEEVGDDFSLSDYYKLNSKSILAEERLIDDNVINAIQADFGDQFVLNNTIKLLWNKIKIGDIMDVQNDIWGTLSYTNRLHEITIPSLVLWGKHDVVTPLEIGQQAFDLLGSADKEIFIFERSAHSPFVYEPNLFADQVIGFINRHK